ncbi:MAG: aminopeptidase [Halobacteriota archaeon]
MIDLELSPVARRIVEDLGEVTPDEEVLVVGDTGSVTVSKALTTAARATGAEASLLVMPRLARQGDEPPSAVAGAMRGADVVFAANEHSLGHTEARKRATEDGTRVAILRGVDEEMLLEGAMTADFERLREVTAAVCDALTAAEDAHVRTPTGTDVELSLSGRAAFPLDGYFHDGAGFSNFPPGLAVSSPVEHTAQGTIVMDYSMDGFGRLDEPITLTIEGGSVTDVAGGDHARQLRETLENADDNAGNLAEFALGTNPEARLVGNLAEDKKRRGVVDFAVGDNTSIGGHTASDIHLDFVVLEATITLDGVVVQSDGVLDVDAVHRVG